ncbi:MAG: glycosyltransferase [Gammaproteobacteria bacterium]|nr:glycosyltransferase [Gammaproteobacteria bacterium]
MPLISVIIPVYNRRSDLKRCLNSIVADAGLVVEVIVIDDNSAEPLDELRPQIDLLLRNEANLGPSYSRNLAAKHARGNILLFLDSDVELLPDTLAAIARILAADPTLACVGGSGPADDTGHDVAYVKTKFYDRSGRNRSVTRTRGDFGDGRLIECDHFESACMAIRRHVFEQIGGFDPYWFYMGEDREICLRLRRAGHRVAVSWTTRAIHHESDLGTKQQAAFRRFLARRFLEVAFKLDGWLGAIRWLANNRDQWRRLGPVQPVRAIARARALRRRRNRDFLLAPSMNEYLVHADAQHR